jgi:chemotaxis protein CheY-P-specific phosphatase CheC
MRVTVDALGRFNRLAHEGSEQAARALGQLTDVEPAVEATSIDLLRHSDIVADFRNEDLVAVATEFSGGITGTALLVFTRPGAKTLAKSLPGDGDAEPNVEPRLTEVGNIMLSGFIDGWADHLRRTIHQDPPTYLTGSGTEILPERTPTDGPSGQVLTVSSVFETSALAVETSAYFFLERDSFESALVEEFTDPPAPVPLDKLQLFSRMAGKGGATAGDNISMMTGIDTTVDISRMRFLRVEHLAAKLGDDRQVGVAVELTGLPSGYVLVLFDEPSARTVAEAMGTEPVDGGFGPMHRSAIEEICNVMISGFVDGWANVLGTSNQHTPPEFVHDFASALVDPIMVDLATEQEHAFVFDTVVQTSEEAVSCQIYALPEERELQRALERLSPEELPADIESRMRVDPDSVFGGEA